jgi:gas vesicle protein
MRPDRGSSGAVSYLAATWVGVALVLLVVLSGAVLGGIIGSNLGYWVGERAGDAARAAGRVCQEGWFDMVRTVDCGHHYAEVYALRFGLIGVLMGLIVGIIVGLLLGPRLGERGMSGAQKKANAETWFAQPQHG